MSFRDIEMGPNAHKLETRHSAIANRHHQAIRTLFGLDAQFAVSWPGSGYFCSHLEKLLSNLVEHEYDIIWTILSYTGERGPRGCWEWCFQVIAAVQEMEPERNSIDAIILQMTTSRRSDHEPNSHEFANLTEPQLDEARRAVFAVLCWISASLTPVLKRPLSDKLQSPPPPKELPGVWVQESKYLVPRMDLRRPVAKLFRGFRDNGDDRAIAPQDALIESSITYASLFRIGHVRLELVDTITSHLQFDSRSRTLSVFRFPSLCLMNILRTNALPIIDGILQELIPAAAGQDPASVHREVLLTYRLLFAQTAQSRKIMKTYLQQARQEDGRVDPLLIVLCTEGLKSFRSKLALPTNVFPFSTLNVDGFLMESSTYSSRDDFTIFGDRLHAIQRYNMRQQPSKMTDLWRDRRNPLQWYTFWAVLWVGGASIILSLFQLGVGAAQLYYASVQGSR